MDINLLISFLGASVILTLLPGPDILFVLTQSLGRGYKVGISIALGLVSGILVHTSLAATGIGLLILNWKPAFDILKYSGAGYLFYLAYKASQETTSLTLEIENPEFKTNFKFFQLFKTGFVMNILNPKVTLFFVVLLPQFIDKHGFNPVFQMLILGLIFMVQSFVIFGSVSLLAAHLSRNLHQTNFGKWVKWIKVAALSLLGILILLN